MKNILFGVFTVVCLAIINGCVNPGPAPQEVKLKNPDGKAVIIKDIYELPLIETAKLKDTEIVKIFFPKDDNVKINYSMTLLKIPSGVSQAKFKQTSAQIIYAISGGGKLRVSNNLIVLKKGVMVYVPPNAPMSISNSVNQILEVIVVTSPPFEPAQMTILGTKPKRVKVQKDSEDEMNNDDFEAQDISDKYRTGGRRKRTLSVDEYREMMNKKFGDEDDEGEEEKSVIPELMKETEKKRITRDTWPLRMPDDTETPLKVLEKKQQEQLIPKTPQKIEDTSTGLVQELTPREQKVTVGQEEDQPEQKKADADHDSLEKLLKDQEKQRQKLLQDQKKQQEKLIPKEPRKVKKTSLKHIQELSPEEHSTGAKKSEGEEEIDPLEKLLKDQEKQRQKLLQDQKKQQEKLIPKEPRKVKKTSLKHIQELSPEEHSTGAKKSEGGEEIDPLEKLLRDQKKQREKLIPKKPQKMKKTSLKHIQELSPEENAIKTKSDEKSEL